MLTHIHTHTHASRHTHALSYLFYLSTHAIKLLIAIILSGRLYIFFIFITEFLVGALEFRMEFRGL